MGYLLVRDYQINCPTFCGCLVVGKAKKRPNNIFSQALENNNKNEVNESFHAMNERNSQPIL
jgi:hypothetical protein